MVGLGEKRSKFLVGQIRRQIVLAHAASERRKCCLNVDHSQEVRYPSPFLFPAADVSCHPAIDVWSAGIIFLFFLTRKFPLFQSNDDVEALMELSAILGRKGMERAATLHSAYDNFPGVFTAHLLLYRSYVLHECSISTRRRSDLGAVCGEAESEPDGA